jgi:archaellum component FlaC
MGTGFGPTGSAYGWTPGQFNETFVVPSLPPGVYAVSVVDSWGATSAAGVFFTITPTPLITVETRATQYYQHDVMSLYTWTNIVPTYDVVWEITDPTGNVYIGGLIETYDWSMVSLNNYMVPYYRIRTSTYWTNQIPDDAPVGVWNFTAYNSVTSAIVDTNLFSVSAKPTMTTVLNALAANTTAVINEIDECCSNLTTLLTELGANITAIDGTIATIETTVGEIDVALTDLDATITGFDGDMVTIKTSLGTVQTTVSSLNADIITIKAGVSGIEGTASSLDAVLGVVAGDTAYLKSAVANITGTVTDVSDGVATIETELGTLRMDVADIKTDVGAVQTDVEASLPVTVDMMPVWIAVVLSLIAAIAAIFAVVTIRQKIAG